MRAAEGVRAIIFNGIGTHDVGMHEKSLRWGKDEVGEVLFLSLEAIEGLGVFHESKERLALSVGGVP